jgi:hypothetical protein
VLFIEKRQLGKNKTQAQKISQTYPNMAAAYKHHHEQGAVGSRNVYSRDLLCMPLPLAAHQSAAAAPRALRSAARAQPACPQLQIPSCESDTSDAP